MALKKEKKKEIVLNLQNSLKDAGSAVFVKFDKLKVADADSFRSDLRKEGVGYIVSKKTLLKNALDTLKFEGEIPELEGQIGVAFGDDILVPSREVFNFHKENKEKVKIVGGIFEGKYKNEEEMFSLATIPPLQTLRGMFVNLINSPIQRFAVVVDQIATSKQ